MSNKSKNATGQNKSIAKQEEVMKTPNVVNSGEKQAKKYDIPKTITAWELINNNYPETDFVKPGFPLKTTGVLMGNPGIGKTYKALQDGLLIAATEEYGKRGGVLYITADESINEIADKVKNIVKTFEFTDEEKKLAKTNFRVLSLLNNQPDLLEELKNDKQPFINAISGIASTYGCDKLRLIIFDNLRQFTEADVNDYKVQKQLLTVFNSICKRINCSCLVLHNLPHYTQFKNMDLQEIDYGSNVFFDSMRYQECMAVMDLETSKIYGESTGSAYRLPDDPIGNERKLFIKWGILKQNYGKPVADKWYKRNSNGVLLKTDIMKTRRYQ